MDPRKPIVTRAAASDAGDVIHRHLLECTARGSRELGCTGASFVTSALGLWAAELAELDGAATRDLMHAIGDIFDPKANPRQKEHAERRRRKAVARLLAAVDLDMNPAAGRA